MTRAQSTAPEVLPDAVTFSFADPDAELHTVSLRQELRRPREGPDFTRNGDGRWRVTFARPEVDRMEYMLAVTHTSGVSRTICDPSNPLRAPGPFGDKSVVEWPEYRAPEWINHDSRSGTIVDTHLESRILRADLPVRLWASPGARADDELPLLVVHDGLDYDVYSKLTLLLDRLTDEGKLPVMRAALLCPVERDEWYSASMRYGRAMVEEFLPQLSLLSSFPSHSGGRIGMGASLGALAMLHIHRGHSDVFGALFLQSGSFFTPRLDGHESRFVRFNRITRFVSRLLNTETWHHPVKVAMTCGTVEENLPNNRATCRALARQGYDVALELHRDAHNWIGWRDALAPTLANLLRSQWGASSDRMARAESTAEPRATR